MSNLSVANEPKVLCVDDELSVLKSLKRVLGRVGYSVDIESVPIDALNLVAENNYDIIISDMRMPNMDGAEFLAASKKFSPDSIRILLSGYSEHQTTVRAINNGKIFSYINKPWDNAKLKSVISEAIKHKSLIDKKREKAELLKSESAKLNKINKSLASQVRRKNNNLVEVQSILELTKSELALSYKTMIRVFSGMVNQKLGVPFEHLKKIVDYSSQLGNTVGLNSRYISEIENAANLYNLGCLVLPDRIIKRKYCNLSDADKVQFEQYPAFGEEALLPLPHMEEVAKIIRSHRENFNGSGFPDGLADEGIPITARILRLVIDYCEKIHRHAASKRQALGYIQQYSGIYYDPLLVNLLIEQVEDDNKIESESTDSWLTVDALEPGMIVSRDLFNSRGMLLLAKGTSLSTHLIQMLNSYHINRGVKLHFYVTVNKNSHH